MIAASLPPEALAFAGKKGASSRETLVEVTDWWIAFGKRFTRAYEVGTGLWLCFNCHELRPLTPAALELHRLWWALRAPQIVFGSVDVPDRDFSAEYVRLRVSFMIGEVSYIALKARCLRNGSSLEEELNKIVARSVL